MIKPFVFADAARVAAKMRERDRLEICATAGTDDPVEAISSLRVIPHIGATVWKDEPIAAIGALLLWPGCASMFMFATDRWREVKIETTRFTRKMLIPSLYDAGMHRLQAHSMADHREAHDWMRFCGADGEIPIPQYGKNREDFVLFVMSREAMGRVTNVVKCGTISKAADSWTRGSGPFVQ